MGAWSQRTGASKNIGEILTRCRFFTARLYAVAVCAVVVCLSVRPSVPYTPALYQNG